MMDEYLVARLGQNASQVLLALLLARKVEVRFSQAEFATRTGLTKRSTSDGLHELERFGLVTIIAQVGKPSLVRLCLEGLGHEEKRNHQANDTVQVATGSTPVLPLEIPPQSRTEAVPYDPLDLCRTADADGDRQKQVSALQAAWDVAFPKEDYPFQRLTPDTAKKFLVGRSAERVAAVILEAPARSRERIQSPRAFISKALENEDKKFAGGDVEEGITDELRNLARLGRERYEAKAKL